MARTKVIVGGIAVIAVLGFGYWKYQSAQQPAIQQAADGATKKAAPAVLVKLDQVSKKDFPLIERNYGTMASPNAVGINARVASQITKVNVQDGQMVKQGDVLVELDDRTLQAQLAKDVATLAKDQATLTNTQTTLDRAQMLFSKNAGSKQDVDNDTALQAAAQKTADADQAVIDADKVQLDFAKIKAPFDGKLGEVNATIGQLVAASTTSTPTTSLMTITQMQPLKVNFRRPQQVLPALRAKMGANGIIAQGDNQFVVRLYTSGSTDVLDMGNLTFVDSTVDQTSGTIGLAGQVGNSKLNLWPGQQVNVELQYGDNKGALTVPTVAVQQGQKGPYIWVVDDQNKVKATPVKAMRYEGETAEIDGLAEGTKVVVEGQARLADGATVRTADAKDQNGQDAAPKAAVTQPAKTEATSSGGAQAATPDKTEKAAQTGTAQP